MNHLPPRSCGRCVNWEKIPGIWFGCGRCSLHDDAKLDFQRCEQFDRGAT